MSRRARHLLLSLVASAAGVGVALVVAGVAPVAAAPPSTASIEAYDRGFRDPANPNQTQVTIAVGGTVSFAYPTGNDFHNVVFDASQPTSCTQTAGTNSGAVPPLPANGDVAGWAGSCQFNTPGTYAFHCSVHPTIMTGAVIVEAATTTDTNTAPTNSSTGPTSTTNTTASLLALPRVTITRHQRGVVVRGTVTTPTAGSRIVATAFSSNRALAKHRPKHTRRVRVGSQTKTSTGTGKTPLAVSLNAAARRALHRRHRLRVDVRVVVTPPSAHPVTTTVTVVLSSPLR